MSSVGAAGAGCAGQRYAGIDLRPGTAASDVQALARRAQFGDKQAQFTLAERYERGIGVPVDRRRSIVLYSRAAEDDPSTMLVYSPSAGNGSVGHVSSVRRVGQAGLQAAKDRLAAMADAGR